jgi:hypothetical protein
MLAALFAACTVGCVPGSGVDLDKIERTQDFFPIKFEMPITLRLANVPIEAEAKMTVDGNTRTIKIFKDGVPIEEEVYIVTTEQISVKSMGTGETFDPPLPLIKLPMSVGDTFDWTGKIVFAGHELEGKAKAVTSRDTPDLATGPRETLRVAVELEISDGSPKPATRKLDYWFAEGVGPIRRDYGNQLRTPR